MALEKGEMIAEGERGDCDGEGSRVCMRDESDDAREPCSSNCCWYLEAKKRSMGIGGRDFTGEDMGFF